MSGYRMRRVSAEGSGPMDEAIIDEVIQARARAMDAAQA